MVKKSKKKGFFSLCIRCEGRLICTHTLEKIAHRYRAEDPTFTRALGFDGSTSLRQIIEKSYLSARSMTKDFWQSGRWERNETQRFMRDFLKNALGFHDIYLPRGEYFLSAGKGRIPILVVAPDQNLEHKSEVLSHKSFSPAELLQDRLNEKEEALWGMVTNGAQLRLMRDNASFSQTTYLEFDLKLLFEQEDLESFEVMWCLLRRDSFGKAKNPASQCLLEEWRGIGTYEGELARARMAQQMRESLEILGTGFLENNQQMREELLQGDISLQLWFQELLRLVYRIIFIITLEDRELLHSKSASSTARKIWEEGYSLSLLRAACTIRACWDDHQDRYEGLKVVLKALSEGESELGIKALGGLFALENIPLLFAGSLKNKDLLQALYKLTWLSHGRGAVAIPWKRMNAQELGCVYECLLELTPHISHGGYRLSFVSEDLKHETSHKALFSYYTPPELVEALLDSTLDPILDHIEKESTDAQQDLLNLAVLDPACGSGHFLLSAAHRIAQRLTKIRMAPTVEGSPSFVQITQDLASSSSQLPKWKDVKKQALRDVVRSCLYGIDVNPMAAELTKVALWLETMERGEPLIFLENRILCGNSLMGIFDFQQLSEGIPAQAFQAFSEDENSYATDYRDKNAQQIAEIEQTLSEDLALQIEELREKLKEDLDSLQILPESTAKQVESKKRRLESIRTRGAYPRLQAASDLYTAAFLIAKNAENHHSKSIPTSQWVWRALKRKVDFAEAFYLARSEKFFHWPLEFPHIMERGGFDVILSNPPPHRIQMLDQKFFKSTHRHIADAEHEGVRKEMIQELESSEPEVFERYCKKALSLDRQSHYYRSSERFPNCFGAITHYALFADLLSALLHPRGRAGSVVPKGLIVGYNNSKFIQSLILEKRLVSFYGFDNDHLIFRNMKAHFGLLTTTGSGGNIEKPRFAAFLSHPSKINTSGRCYVLSEQDIRLLNPNTLNPPCFRSAYGAELTRSLYSKMGVLVNEVQEDNHWCVDLSSTPVAPEHRTKHDGIGEGKIYPVYESSRLGLYNHHYSGEVSEVKAYRELQRPRYWVSEEKLDRVRNEGRAWCFLLRAGGSKQRLLVGTMVPIAAYAGGIIQITARVSHAEYLALAALFSSLVLEYAAQQKTNRTVAHYILKQLPFPRPQMLRRTLPWLSHRSAIQWLAERAFELYYTHSDLRAMAQDMEYHQEPFSWDSERRKLLQAELDALIFHLFDLSRWQAAWLMESLQDLKSWEEKHWGSYITRDKTLEIYEKIQKVREEGIAFQAESERSGALQQRVVQEEDDDDQIEIDLNDLSGYLAS